MLTQKNIYAIIIIVVVMLTQKNIYAIIIIAVVMLTQKNTKCSNHRYTKVRYI